MRALLRRFVHDQIARILTAPLGSYLRSSGQDVEQLKQHMRKGDVLLVCGDQRVSEVIRYLTQSSWSHSAIYVGDELLRRYPERADDLIARFGEEAEHLVVEALLEEGVVASPLSKYRGFQLRLCRPFGLTAADCEVVMRLVIEQIGGEYDLDNLLDLARYFMPVSLVPARLRRDALELGSGRPTEVICSSMIARAFDAVGFPILPRNGHDLAAQAEAAVETEAEGTRRLYHTGGYANGDAPSWPSRRPLAHHLRSQHRPAALITPRDFDLSPYFEIVKFSLIEQARREAESEAPAASSMGMSMARRAAAVIPLWRRFRRTPQPGAIEPGALETVGTR